MNSKDPFQERIEQLEKDVERLKNENIWLRQKFEEVIGSAGAEPDEAKDDSRHEEPPKADIDKAAKEIAPKPDKLAKRKFEWDSEYWINKIGIALLLFGVAFLFKYSIDKGWLTPMARLVIGFAISFILLETGVRIHLDRRRLSQVFLGGGAAALYITVYASYQIYHLAPYPVAFYSMILVTILTFIMSLKQNEAMLSCIAAIGGLATPFVLFTESSSIPHLIIYVSSILIGATGIYFYKRWQSLLWVSFIGVWIIFAVVGFSLPYNRGEDQLDRWIIEAGLILSLIAFWIVPVLREALTIFNPEKLPKWLRGSSTETVKSAKSRYAHRMALMSPLIFSLLTHVVWNLKNYDSGMVCIALAVMYAAISFIFSKTDSLKDYFYTHAYVSATLLAISFGLMFTGNGRFIAIAAEACALAFMARKLDTRGFAIQSHLLFLITLGILVDHLFDSRVREFALINSRALVDLFVMTIALLAAYSFKNKNRETLYRLILATLLMGWLARELSPVAFGYDYLIVSWIVLGYLLRLYSTRYDDKAFNIFSHAVFAIVGSWVFYRFQLHQSGDHLFLNHQALADLFVIVIAIVASFSFKDKMVRLLYKVGPYLAFLALLYREFLALHNGQGYVSASWALCAIILLLSGIRMNHALMLNAALGTIVLVVGKLFWIDLSKVEPVWRIFLFLGFGAALLVISYFFNKVRKPE